MKISYNPKATATTRKRYQRITRFYDLMEGGMEKWHGPWRKQLWSLVKGPNVLEVGVGTGKNIPYYPENLQIHAIDLTPGMLDHARTRAKELGRNVALSLGDVQCLDFADDTFDTVAATFVFCSVPNPTLGLQEVRRVLKPDGTVLLLEHIRAETLLLGKLMDWLNPVAVRVMGANINRRTVENVHRSGLEIVRVENLDGSNIYKLIIARSPKKITKGLS